MALNLNNLNIIGRGIIILGVLIMLASHLFRSDKHPGFQLNLKSLLLRGPYIWENKEWYTGPGYYLQNIGFGIMMLGIVVTVSTVFGPAD